MGFNMFWAVDSKNRGYKVEFRQKYTIFPFEYKGYPLSSSVISPQKLKISRQKRTSNAGKIARNNCCLTTTCAGVFSNDRKHLYLRWKGISNELQNCYLLFTRFEKHSFHFQDTRAVSSCYQRQVVSFSISNHFIGLFVILPLFAYTDSTYIVYNIREGFIQLREIVFAFSLLQLMTTNDQLNFLLDSSITMLFGISVSCFITSI